MCVTVCGNVSACTTVSKVQKLHILMEYDYANRFSKDSTAHDDALTSSLNFILTPNPFKKAFIYHQKYDLLR